MLKAQMRGGRLSAQNMFLLVIVQELDDMSADGTHPGELARRACLSSAAITAALDDLVEGGFCVRAHSEVDRRKVVVHVTPYGRQVLAETRDETRALFRGILSGWDDERASRLRLALEDLDASVQAALRPASLGGEHARELPEGETSPA
jgi:DNA-binding MarR family transcriptional regulator